MSLNKVCIYIFSMIVMLSAQVKDEDPDVRLEDYLSSLPSTAASVTTLLEAIYQGSDEIKAKSISAVARMKPTPPEAFELFKKYLGYGDKIITVNKNKFQDKSWEIRANCAVGFARLKSPEAGILIREQLIKEKNIVVKKALIYALGEIKDDVAVPMILNIMEKTKDESLIIECAQALGKTESKKAFLPLMQISTGNHLPVTKREAIRALEKIKW